MIIPRGILFRMRNVSAKSMLSSLQAFTECNLNYNLLGCDNILLREWFMNFEGIN
jgi:hypothetical protein